MHDAILFEQAGVPAATVLTRPFTALATTISASLGMPGSRELVVEHPIFGRPRDWLAEAVDGVLEAACAHLLSVDRQRGQAHDC